MAQCKSVVDFFDGLHLWQNKPWYKGKKCDSKEWDLNEEHPFPRVLGYQTTTNITRVDIMKFRVYLQKEQASVPSLTLTLTPHCWLYHTHYPIWGSYMLEVH
jgi:hypothetical protein